MKTSMIPSRIATLASASTLALLLAACASASAPVVRPRAPLPTDGGTRAPAPAMADEVVARTNDARRGQGLAALGRNAKLMRAAQIQAEQMAAANAMAHDLPGAPYPSLDARLGAVSYEAGAAGENVAEGYPSAEAAVAGWMRSSGHRANIVSPRYVEMGAGVATSSRGRTYYAQVFGTPR
jgi:uncharacterized protein YkwD